MSRTLIIGGNGNIGFAAAARFLAAGDAVVCFNRGLSGPVPDGAALVIGDRRDRESLEKVARSATCDVVVDLTCYDAEDAARSARAFADAGHLVHCSSVATYGRRLKTFPADETTPLRPENEYGRGKVAADRVIQAAHADAGLRATIIKPAICYGAKFGLLRQLGQDLSWLSRIRAGKPILVSGDGIALHQFMHVDDVAEAIYLIARSDALIGETVNLVNSNVVSWDDYHRTAMDVLGREVDLIGASAAQILAACAQIGHTLTDILSHNSFFSDRKLSEATGFAPRIWRRASPTSSCWSWTTPRRTAPRRGFAASTTLEFA